MTETALVPVTEKAMEKTNNNCEVFFNADLFGQLQRGGKMLAESGLMPDHLKSNVAGCSMVLSLAYQLNEHPFTVASNMFLVHGKPAFGASFLIAKINTSGLFTPLNFEEIGKGPDLSVRCFAKRIPGGELCEYAVSMKMANAEGWTKRNPKYNTMGGLMLRYRSASAFSRLFCPEVTMGMHTVEELKESEIGNTINSADEINAKIQETKKVNIPKTAKIPE